MGRGVRVGWSIENSPKLIKWWGWAVLENSIAAVRWMKFISNVEIEYKEAEVFGLLSPFKITK